MRYGRFQEVFDARDDRSGCHMLHHWCKCCVRKQDPEQSFRPLELARNTCSPSVCQCGRASTAERHVASSPQRSFGLRGVRVATICRSRRSRRLAAETPWTRAPSDMAPAKGTPEGRQQKETTSFEQCHRREFHICPFSLIISPITSSRLPNPLLFMWSLNVILRNRLPLLHPP